MKVYDCEQCGFWHPAGFTGDCRDDANRIDISEPGVDYIIVPEHEYSGLAALEAVIDNAEIDGLNELDAAAMVEPAREALARIGAAIGAARAVVDCKNDGGDMLGAIDVLAMLLERIEP